MDHSLFLYHKDDVYLALLICADNLVLAGNDSHLFQMFTSYLHLCIKLKKSRSLKYFFGIMVACASTGLLLCQQKYTFDIFSETNTLGGKPDFFTMK